MRALRAALVGALLLALVGCTNIPTTGSVRTGPTVAPNDPGLTFVPNPPADGADPQTIVQGFVAAATEGAPYDVAKQFLTPGFAKQWKPNASVLIHDDSWTTVAISAAKVDLSVRVAAQVDAKGVYEPVARQRHLDFDLERVGGQWRIATAPDGVLLATTVFQRLFAQERLQFFDRTWSRLVPDLRWYPDSSDQRSAVVRSLIAGPAAPIGGGVTATAFPRGTTFDGVTSSGGSTVVALSMSGDPGADATARMQQQLSSSLGISTGSLRLSVNGRVAPSATQAPVTQVVLRPFVVADGRFGSLSQPAGALQVDPELGPRIAAANPTAVTFSTRQRLAAVQLGTGLDAPAGQIAIVTPEATKVIDRRAPLAAPTLDQQQWVYSVPTDDPDGLIATSVKGTKVSMDASLGGSAVSSIEASQDGTRMLVVVQTDDGPRAYVAGILRRADGTPTGLTTEAYPVAVGGEFFIGATWVDSSDVAVLTSDSDGQNQAVTQQQLGGFARGLDRLSGARQLVGTSGDDDLRTLLQNGDVNTSSSGTGWSSEFSRPVKVSVLAVQR